MARFVAASLLLLSGWMLALPAPVTAVDDVQAWTDAALVGRIQEGLFVSLREEFKLADDVSRFDVQNTDLGLIWNPTPTWTIGTNYRAEFSRKSNDDFRVEHRPHLNVTLARAWGSLDLSDRSRLEGRFFSDEKQDTFRYRNRFQVVLPPVLRGVRPYVADEVFVETNGNGFDQNRGIAGLSGLGTERLGAKGWAMVQSVERPEEWEHRLVFGLSLTFRP